MDFRRQKNCGFAFVNFASHSDAGEALRQLPEVQSWGSHGDRRIVLAWSESQGFKTHVDRYQNSPVMHEQVDAAHKPAIFADGMRQPFPAPSKRLSLPYGFSKR